MQRIVQTELSELRDAVAAAELRPPSLIIIGECVREHDALSWFEQRPLLGQRIAIARPDEQCEQAIHDITLHGGQPIVMPAIRIEPIEDWSEVDATIDQLADFHWLVFTSVNGVRGLLQRLWERGADARQLASLKIATIGPSTAEALHAFGLRADLVPEAYRAEELANALREHVRGKRVLWARASRGRDVLPEELQRAGAKLTQLVVYQNIDEPEWPADVRQQLDQGEVDGLCLTSPSIARNALRQLSPVARDHITAGRLRLATISPVTSATVAKAGMPIAAEATTYTWPGVLEAIVAACPSP
jgi:uroporphyrinogen III methyltransferase/synthase